MTLGAIKLIDRCTICGSPFHPTQDSVPLVTEYIGIYAWLIFAVEAIVIALLLILR